MLKVLLFAAKPPFRIGTFPRALTAALLVLLVSYFLRSPEITAKAPPLATTVLDAGAYSAPSYDAASIATIPAGTEVELTGTAAPGFLGVYYDGQEVFVPAQFLSLGVRPGIDTAVTVEDTPLLEAPMRDALIQVTVPEGQTVLLTGATVDGYDAASYDGAGGWINGRDLAQ